MLTLRPYFNIYCSYTLNLFGLQQLTFKVFVCFSLGFYAKMIQEALGKTISEGQVQQLLSIYLVINKKLNWFLMLSVCGLTSGLMISGFILDQASPGLSLGQDHCIVFLGKTLHPHNDSFNQVYKWVQANLMGWG